MYGSNVYTALIIHLSTVGNFIIYSYFRQQNEYVHVANYPYLFYFAQNKMSYQLITLI